MPARGAGGHILVVDDEPMILDLLRVVLKSHWTVHCAPSAADALAILGREPIDVIISDQRMPEITGVELLTWVRDRYPRCTRILITGFAELEAVVQGINEAKIWHYATKPWDNRELVTLIERAVERTRRGLDAQEQLRAGFRSLIQMQERSHPFSRGHSGYVTRVADLIAEAFELPPEARRVVVTAAELHDIGRLGVGNHYLDRDGPLDDDTWGRVRQHVDLGAEMLADAGLEPAVVGLVARHHERLDGSGYPGGLSGDEIPLGARILGLADSFAAMTAPRAYRPPMETNAALAELREQSGGWYDAEMVDALCVRLQGEGSP